MLLTFGIKNQSSKMKKIFFLLAVTLSVVEGSFAQQDTGRYIRKGLIRSMGTISAGELLKENASTISIHGCLEYYVADNVSLRGDSYYSLKSGPLEFNHSIFSGASYHFKTKNHFDSYFAFEPGIAISQEKDYSDHIFCDPGPCPYGGKTSANPLMSYIIGFNFYFQKFFNLFGEARYISGKHLSDATTPLSLNELRFSFGLGFNINVLKKK